MKYTMIEADEQGLIQFVQENLDEGWELYGPPFHTRTVDGRDEFDGGPTTFPFMAQAMIMHETDTEREARWTLEEAAAKASEQRWREKRDAKAGGGLR